MREIIEEDRERCSAEEGRKAKRKCMRSGKQERQEKFKSILDEKQFDRFKELKAKRKHKKKLKRHAKKHKRYSDRD